MMTEHAARLLWLKAEANLTELLDRYRDFPMGYREAEMRARAAYLLYIHVQQERDKRDKR